MDTNDAPYPHCDSNVLHKPGACEFCDMYPEAQKKRMLDGVRFTGQPDVDGLMKPCPSETYRPLDVIERWPGNRPSPIKRAPFFGTMLVPEIEHTDFARRVLVLDNIAPLAELHKVMDEIELVGLTPAPPLEFPNFPIFPIFPPALTALEATDAFTRFGDLIRELSPFFPTWKEQLKWWQRPIFAVWLFRLTVIGYNFRALLSWEESCGYYWHQPEAWIDYYLDGYNAYEAMKEDLSYAD